MKFWVGVMPPKEIFDEILKIQEEIANKYNTYYSLENRIGPHVTISFQKSIEEKSLKQVEDIIDACRSEPFKVTVQGVGRFYKTNTIYMGVKSKELKKLNKCLVSRLRQFGEISLPRKRFTGHITVAYEDVKKEDFQEYSRNSKRETFFMNFLQIEYT